jgi:flavin-dependent dehydrogenase
MIKMKSERQIGGEANMGKKKALVIGCGIAGPAVAMFLRRAGVEPHLFEAKAEPDDYAGLFLNVARNGLHVLGELGVDARIRGAGIEILKPDCRIFPSSNNGKWCR